MRTKKEILGKILDLKETDLKSIFRRNRVSRSGRRWASPCLTGSRRSPRSTVLPMTRIRGSPMIKRTIDVSFPSVCWCIKRLAGYGGVPQLPLGGTLMSHFRTCLHSRWCPRDDSTTSSEIDHRIDALLSHR